MLRCYTSHRLSSQTPKNPVNVGGSFPWWTLKIGVSMSRPDGSGNLQSIFILKGVEKVEAQE